MTNRPCQINPTTLRFSLEAWLQLQYLCHIGDTEIGAFGIASDDDLLYIRELYIPQQTCSAASVEFDDEAVAAFFEKQVDLDRHPRQFARIWIHTHPGDSPEPSGVDEETFSRVFGDCDWAVMFILACGGATYARLRIGSEEQVAASIVIDVDVDYRQASLWDSNNLAAIDDWRALHERQVQPERIASMPSPSDPWNLLNDPGGEPISGPDRDIFEDLLEAWEEQRDEEVDHAY